MSRGFREFEIRRERERILKWKGPLHKLCFPTVHPPLEPLNLPASGRLSPSIHPRCRADGIIYQDRGNATFQFPVELIIFQESRRADKKHVQFHARETEEDKLFNVAASFILLPSFCPGISTFFRPPHVIRVVRALCFSLAPSKYTHTHIYIFHAKVVTMYLTIKCI